MYGEYVIVQVTSVMHERRVKIYGFPIVVQEASWHFRQGLGRLVRREGVKSKKLWVLDSRLDGKASWEIRFKRMLNDRYKKK